MTDIWIYNGQVYTAKPEDVSKRLTVHYLYDDSAYNVVDFSNNDNVLIQDGLGWKQFTSLEIITATMYPDGLLRIAPKYNGGNVTPDYTDPNVLNTTGDGVTDGWGYPYTINYDRVASGTTELWILNGQVYTKDPTVSITLHFVAGTSASNTVQCSGSHIISGISIGDFTYTETQDVVVRLAANGYLQIVPKRNGVAVSPDLTQKDVLDTGTDGEYYYITSERIQNGLTNVWAFDDQVYQDDPSNLYGIQSAWEPFFENYGDAWKAVSAKRKLHEAFEKAFGSLSQARVPESYAKKVFSAYPTKDWATKPLYWVPYPYDCGNGEVFVIYMASRATSWKIFNNAKDSSDYRKGYIVVIDGKTYVRGTTQICVAWPYLPLESDSDPTITYSKENYIQYLLDNGFTLVDE